MIDAIRQQALRLLARREHSKHELRRKLAAKGWDTEQVSAVLEELSADKCQSDERFLNGYIRYRSGAGYGPRRIAAELAERGIREIPAEVINENSEEWMKVLERVWQKKFNRQNPRDIEERARQIRFLIYRGFTPEQAHEFMGGL